MIERRSLQRRKERRIIILLDETKVKRNGKIAYVSACIDVARREIVSAKSYRSVSIISTVDTLKPALDACSREKPLFIVDHLHGMRARSSGSASIGSRSHSASATTSRGGIARSRTTGPRRLCNNFGIRNNDRAIKRVKAFVHLFAYWYNHTRPHETLDGNTPSQLILTLSA